MRILAVWFALLVVLPSERASTQDLTLDDLHGIEVNMKIVRQQIQRRDGPEYPVKIDIDWTIIIQPEGMIRQTIVSIAHTPRGTQKPITLATSFVLDKPQQVGSFGDGHGVWQFKEGTLTFVRTFPVGAYRNNIAFTRDADGLKCVSTEAFARENGKITLNSMVDGARINIISSKQISSRCSVKRA
jgi:hypothetical protein